MKLHNNKESFNNLISIISDYYKIDAALIEKDYYVTCFFKKIKEKQARKPALNAISIYKHQI